MSGNDKWNQDVVDSLDGLVSRLVQLRAASNLNSEEQERVLNAINGAIRYFNRRGWNRGLVPPEERKVWGAIEANHLASLVAELEGLRVEADRIREEEGRVLRRIRRANGPRPNTQRKRKGSDKSEDLPKRRKDGS